MKTYWYIDASGNKCSTDSKVSGMNYKVVDQYGYKAVQLIVAHTGELFEEYVAYDSEFDMEKSLKD